MKSLKTKYIANPKYVKVLYLSLFLSTFIVFFYQTHTNYVQGISPRYAPDLTEVVLIRNHRSKLKYILLWTHPEDTPFVYFGRGSAVFQNKSCQWSNCYVTGDRNFLQDITQFNVIAFSSSRLLQMSQELDIPARRSDYQKYVFASVESAEYYPICTNEWNNFFNWTWTYKLKSDAVWGYIVIRNATGHVIGPKSDMHWINPIDMEDTDEDLRRKLSSKNKVAAWFASNCETLSRREKVVEDIDRELNKYKLNVHTFGKCGKYYCPKIITNRCFKLLERDYFFYFAFENSFSEDYVTEKLLYALQHNTVPVVYGGANYSRHESSDTDDYCRFCAILNNETLVKRETRYTNIKTWWTDKNINCVKK